VKEPPEFHPVKKRKKSPPPRFRWGFTWYCSHQGREPSTEEEKWEALACIIKQQNKNWVDSYKRGPGGGCDADRAERHRRHAFQLREWEWELLKRYQELLALCRRNGYAMPPDTMPSFLTTPPKDGTTTKWIRNFEFQWHQDRRVWLIRRKRIMTENAGTTYITGEPRQYSSVIELNWHFDETAGIGKWTNHLKTVLEPDEPHHPVSILEPIYALTQFDWNSDINDWVPRYRRVLDSQVSWHQYTEYHWHSIDPGSVSGEWVRQQTVVDLNYSHVLVCKQKFEDLLDIHVDLQEGGLGTVTASEDWYGNHTKERTSDLRALRARGLLLSGWSRYDEEEVRSQLRRGGYYWE
jgi:hypothetical protein